MSKSARSGAHENGSCKSDLHDFELHLHWETDKAILVSDDGNKDAAKWLPKSKIEFEMMKGGIVAVTCPEWLAIDKGLL